MKITYTILSISLALISNAAVSSEIQDESRNYSPKYDTTLPKEKRVTPNISSSKFDILPNQKEINLSSRNYDLKYDLFKQQEMQRQNTKSNTIQIDNQNLELAKQRETAIANMDNLAKNVKNVDVPSK